MKRTSVLVALPPLDAPCPKCEYEPSAIVPKCPECGEDLAGLVPPPAHQMQWVAAANDPLVERPVLLPYSEPSEHMQITCRRCSYSWPAATGSGPRKEAS